MRAGEMSPVAYFPLMFKSEVPRYEGFGGAEMPWNVWLRDDSEPIDGLYYLEGGRLVAEMGDNRANFVAYPDWRPLGDFQIDADIRFRDGEWLNGVGVVFGGETAERNGREQWIEYYAFLLAWNFKQHNWGFARVRDNNYTWLTRMGGAPATVRWFSEWNHVTIVRRGSNIKIYCNGVQLPKADYDDGTYGTNRLVGVLATTYEINKGKNEYDNFLLTPLSMPY